MQVASPTNVMYMQVPQTDDTGTLQGNEVEGNEPTGETEESFDIPADAYGAAILALVRDVPCLCDARKQVVSVYNCVFGFGLLILNIFMQFALLGYVDYNVVNFDVYHVQDQYAGFRQNVYQDGAFEEGKWNDYSELQKQYLCAVGMTNSVFYYCCIFCWTLTVMIEARTNINFATDVWRMPVRYQSIEQIRVQISDGKESESVVGLTRFSRISIFCYYCFPKVCYQLLFTLARMQLAVSC
jgi:hypothetical protein